MPKPKTKPKTRTTAPRLTTRNAAKAKAPKTPKVSPLRGVPVDEWVKTKTSGWQAAVVQRLIEVAQKAAPDTTLSIKWAQPVFEHNGPSRSSRLPRPT